MPRALQHRHVAPWAERVTQFGDVEARADHESRAAACARVAIETAARSNCASDGHSGTRRSTVALRPARRGDRRQQASAAIATASASARWLRSRGAARPAVSSVQAVRMRRDQQPAHQIVSGTMRRQRVVAQRGGVEQQRHRQQQPAAPPFGLRAGERCGGAGQCREQSDIGPDVPAQQQRHRRQREQQHGRETRPWREAQGAAQQREAAPEQREMQRERQARAFERRACTGARSTPAPVP